MNLLQIDPVAFSIGSWPVYWYGLLIGFGMLVGYLMYIKEAERKGIDKDLAFDLFFWTIIIGFIGARVYYVIFSWEKYAGNPISSLYIWQGGLAIYGGIIAGAIVLMYFSKKYIIDIRNLIDIAIPSLMVGQIIGRWGNFINQEAHGGPVSHQFLVSLKLPSWLIDQMNIGGQYYHPTFLYESFWNFIGLVIILYLRNKEEFLKSGEISAFYLIWYGFGRYYIEGLRTDSLYLGNFRVSQIVSLFLLLIGITYILMIRTRQTHTTYYSENRK